jgi:betaine-aldehyde dehydrogenase
MTPRWREAVAKNWIDGDWADSTDRRDVFDPATGLKIGTYANAGDQDVLRALAAAVRAFRTASWKDDGHLRARVLNAMADRFETRRRNLIDLIALEHGKVNPEVIFEVELVAPGLRFNAALAQTEYDRASTAGPGRIAMVLPAPIGVTGVLSPWSSPLALTIRALAPALSAGCTTVVALANETAPINALFMEIIARTPDVPPGVVNVLNTDIAARNFLVESPDMPAISPAGARNGHAIVAIGPMT